MPAPVATPVETAPVAETPAEDNGAAKKISRVKYPGLFNADGDRFKDPNTGKATLLKEWPKDFRSSLHHPLQQNFFSDETVYLDKKISNHENAIKKLKEERDLVTRYTNADERKAAMKAKSTFNTLLALVKTLKESGQDPKELGIDLSMLKI